MRGPVRSFQCRRCAPIDIRVRGRSTTSHLPRIALWGMSFSAPDPATRCIDAGRGEPSRGTRDPFHNDAVIHAVRAVAAILARERLNA